MTRARELARLGNENVLSVEDDSLEVGINSTKPTSALDVAGQFNVGTAIKAGVAGVITATEFSGTTGTFSGNVSVGGTLTYEDVTNIDSVGIITAQSGIVVSGGEVKVGSAITIQAHGGVSIAGIVTIGGNLNVQGDIVYDEITGRNLNITGISTQAGQVNFGTSGVGATIAANGNATFSGIVTAKEFVGVFTSAGGAGCLLYTSDAADE